VRIKWEEKRWRLLKNQEEYIFIRTNGIFELRIFIRNYQLFKTNELILKLFLFIEINIF
jgi:hypothetical protein